MVQRRKFSKRFKREAVNLVLSRGVSIAQAARELGLNENLLSGWVREFRHGEQ
jgi:transposase